MTNNILLKRKLALPLRFVKLGMVLILIYTFSITDYCFLCLAHNSI